MSKPLNNDPARWEAIVEHLPIVGGASEGKLPDSAEDASAVLSFLKNRDPKFYKAIDDATDQIVSSVIDELDTDADGDYHLTPNELNGLVARSCRRGGAIALSGIGVANTELALLEAQAQPQIEA